jgi:hypothetical protein
VKATLATVLSTLNVVVTPCDGTDCNVTSRCVGGIGI